MAKSAVRAVLPDRRGTPEEFTHEVVAKGFLRGAQALYGTAGPDSPAFYGRFTSFAGSGCFDEVQHYEVPVFQRKAPNVAQHWLFKQDEDRGAKAADVFFKVVHDSEAKDLQKIVNGGFSQKVVSLPAYLRLRRNFSQGLREAVNSGEVELSHNELRTAVAYFMRDLHFSLPVIRPDLKPHGVVASLFGPYPDMAGSAQLLWPRHFKT